MWPFKLQLQVRKHQPLSNQILIKFEDPHTWKVFLLLASKFHSTFLFNIGTWCSKRFVYLIPYVDLYGIVKIPLRDRNSKKYSTQFLFYFTVMQEKENRPMIYLIMKNNIISNLIICGIVLVIVKYLNFTIGWY